jgi:hypothetical protein
MIDPLILEWIGAVLTAAKKAELGKATEIQGFVLHLGVFTIRGGQHTRAQNYKAELLDHFHFPGTGFIRVGKPHFGTFENLS